MPEVWFMPWFRLKEPLKVGPVDIWPFYGNESRIADPQLRDDLGLRFAQYRGHQNVPAQSISVCSIGEPDLRTMTDEENAWIRRAVDVLIFCSIAEIRHHELKNKTRLLAPCSERFELYRQRFVKADKGISIATRWNWSVYFDLKDISFPEPFMLRPEGFSNVLSRQLLPPLSALLERPTTSFGERIFSSLEWFRLCHYDNPEILSTKQAVLGMVSAFETALGSEHTKLALGRKLDNLCKDKRLERSSKKIGDIPDAVDFSNLVWWFLDVYDLRSDIVHGLHKKLTPTRFAAEFNGGRLPHLVVMDVALREVFARLLHRHKFIDEVKLACCGLDALHKQLGWANP